MMNKNEQLPVNSVPSNSTPKTLDDYAKVGFFTQNKKQIIE